MFYIFKSQLKIIKMEIINLENKAENFGFVIKFIAF